MTARVEWRAKTRRCEEMGFRFSRADIEYARNPNYGKLECFHCTLSPDGDDPIFIGINRLIAKGLNNGEQGKDGAQYPCLIVNRFQCLYERPTNK